MGCKPVTSIYVNPADTSSGLRRLFVTGMMVFIVLMIAAVFGAIYYFTADAETSQGIKQFMNSMFRVPFEALTEKVHQLMGQAAAPAQRVEL